MCQERPGELRQSHPRYGHARRPLAQGTISFADDRLGPKIVVLGEGATYSVLNLRPGDIPVAVTHDVVGAPPPPDFGNPDADKKPRGPAPRPAEVVPVPAKYRNPATSGLKLAVPSGQPDVVFDVALTSK